MTYILTVENDRIEIQDQDGNIEWLVPDIEAFRHFLTTLSETTDRLDTSETFDDPRPTLGNRTLYNLIHHVGTILH